MLDVNTLRAQRDARIHKGVWLQTGLEIRTKTNTSYRDHFTEQHRQIRSVLLLMVPRHEVYR